MRILRPVRWMLERLKRGSAPPPRGRRRSKSVPTKNTYIELRLRDAMVVAGLGAEFRQQYRLGRYSMDFAFPAVHLCVEADGIYWHSHPNAVAKDQRRDAFMRKHGWAVLRFTGPQIIKHPHSCARVVRGYFRRMKGGWRPTGLQRPRGGPPTPPTPPKKLQCESVAFRTANLLKANGVKVPGDLRLMADQGV